MFNLLTTRRYIHTSSTSSPKGFPSYRQASRGGSHKGVLSSVKSRIDVSAEMRNNEGFIKWRNIRYGFDHTHRSEGIKLSSKMKEIHDISEFGRASDPDHRHAFPGSSHDGGIITGSTVEHGLSLENRYIAASEEEAYTRARRLVDSSRWKQLLSPTSSEGKLLTSGGTQHDIVNGIINDATEDDEENNKMEGVVGGGYSQTEYLSDREKEGIAGGIERNDNNNEYETFDMLQSPFGEYVVSSNNANYAHGGKMGEFNYMHHYKQTDPTFLHIQELYPEVVESRKIERMLLDVLSAPIPVDEKRKEVLDLCRVCLSQKLYLQSQSVESLFCFLSFYTSKDISEARKLIPTHQIEGQDESLPNTAIPLYNPLPLMQSMYFHMRSTFTAPTTIMMELLMEVTHRNLMLLDDARKNKNHRLALVGSARNAISEGEPYSNNLGINYHPRQLSNRPINQKEGHGLYNFAHRIVADSERFTVLLSKRTYAMYFDMCGYFDDMGTALWRLAHSQTHLHIIPSPQMLCGVLRGLLKNGNIEEALMFVGKISQVEMTLPLLNATLEIFLMSSDPRACFTVMDAIRTNKSDMYALTPNEETFSLLLLACESMNEWSEAPRLLGEMQKLKIRGDTTCLNLMLKGLLKNDLREYAFQLRSVMRKKGVSVWPQIDQGVSELFPEDSALKQQSCGADMNLNEVYSVTQETDNVTTHSSSLTVSSSTVDLMDSFSYIIPTAREPKLSACDNGADVAVKGEVTKDMCLSDVDNPNMKPLNQCSTSNATMSDSTTIGVWDVDETGAIDRLDDISITVDEKKLADIFNAVSPEELKGRTTAKDYFNAANDVNELTASVNRTVKPLIRQRRCNLTGKGFNGLTTETIDRTRPHQSYVTPKSASELQRLLKSGNGAAIDREYLLSFLNKSGVRVSQEQHSNKAALVRKAHKVVFGVSGVSAHYPVSRIKEGHSHRS